MLIILAKIAVKKSPKKLISAKKIKESALTNFLPKSTFIRYYELYANIHENPGSKMILKHFDIHKALSSFRTTFQFIWAFQHL